MANEITLTAADATEYCPATTAFVAKANELIAAGDEEALAALRNANMDSVLALRETQKRAEFGAKQIKAFLETICEACEDTLPKNIKWNKQSFTTKFADAQAAIFKLIDIENTPMENFLQFISPKDAAKAAGITDERLEADLAEYIVKEAKKRTLNIK